MALVTVQGAFKPSQVNDRSNNGILRLPTELILDITDCMDTKDICSLRHTCNGMRSKTEIALVQILLRNKVIYSRSASMAHFFAVLNAFSAMDLGAKVQSLTLVADGLKEHEYGSEWAWEEMDQQMGLGITAEDHGIIIKINRDHTTEVRANDTFLNSGQYRATLAGILQMCPNLHVLNIRMLQPNEHVPGWTDVSQFEKLSFHRPGLDIKSIYYGDWQYDTVHLRQTHYKDEFGDTIIEANAGPQAGFSDDLAAALASTLASTGRVIEPNYLD